ncbi:S-adenosylmethionine decarboxylase family protein [Chryseobacterium daecheongense]|uniref:Adenosylmethionine decarboxylase n=1 Tax=Chryseobacterium daecheongense TaxID=192389 RepID=A0A3N0VS79_9FLAO|nr:S-adenosylmethionine decarboxylase [Chryseobacterium daecheongense]ROH95662.1 adenosylmethionine decarboxylase [Chryseobacterium daecheongense]TDX91957.1 S-adenosylmethionine decarboxylase [Chryseobacterium daecheongense]
MDSLTSKGLHILLTLETESEDLLLDSKGFLESVRKILENKAVEIVGITNHVFENQSFTSAVCLKESHLCVHTWPEFRQLTFDVFLCNYLQDNTDKVEQIADEVICYFNAEIIQKHKIYR